MAGPLDRLICPPYDVIAPAEAARLLDRDAHNAIHIELGPGATDPAAPDNRYTRAAATLDRWIDDGTLRQDAAPCLYVYEQEFTLDGASRRRLAFFAAVRLVPWTAGEVLPHEETLAAPKRDRLALLAATHANISPIYALCDAGLPGVAALLASAVQQEPTAVATDDAGTHHRLWAVADPDLAGGVTTDLAVRPLYIADGHHRYETALAYAATHGNGDGGGPEGAGYVLMAITPVDDPGLVVLPTHRLVRDLTAERVAYALTRLHEFFEVELVEGVPPAGPLLVAMSAAMSAAIPDPAFGLYTRGLARLLRPRRAPAEALPHLNPAVRALDVAVLQSLLFEELLGLTPDDLRRQSYVDYTRDADEALRRVDDGGGTYQLAVLLNGTPPDAILSVARAGAQMPQKSTYFYPKLATGLIMRRFNVY